MGIGWRGGIGEGCIRTRISEVCVCVGERRYNVYVHNTVSG